MKYYYLFFLFLIPIVTFAQSVYKGRVAIQNELLHPVLITNTTQNHSLESDAYGYFFIRANKGDTIKFESERIHTKTVVVTDSLLSRLQPVYLVSSSTELKEITINEYDANFLKLAQAQQKIHAEKSLNPNMDILGLIKAGVGFFVKKKPKKKVTNDELNKMEFFSPPPIEWKMNDRLAQLPDSFYIETIDLPKHLIEPFIYFVSQTPQFSSWISTEDETFLVSKLLEQKKWFLDYYNKR